MALHCLIEGRVQGVFFRANTCRQAKKRNITGWVRNLQDGRVEVLACGEPPALENFKTWLNQGPIGAKVTRLTVHDISWEPHTDFVVKTSG